MTWNVQEDPLKQSMVNIILYFGKGLPYGVEMIFLSVPAALRKDSSRGKTNTRVARMARADAIGDVEAVLKLATEIPTAIHKKKSEEGAPCLACHFLFLSALSRSGSVINNKQRVLLVFPPWLVSVRYNKYMFLHGHLKWTWGSCI